MRVCILPSDTSGIGSYRTFFPGRELEKRGHEVFAHVDKRAKIQWDADGRDVPLVNSLEFEAGGKVSRTFDADTYVFQRRMEQASPAAIRMLRRQGKFTVYELDDNYDLVPEGSPQWESLRKASDRLRVEWMNESIHWADVVTVSTPALKDWYEGLNSNIVVLPNFLDWEMWRDVQPQFEVERPRVRVGWMGWLRWRGSDLEALRSWLAPWLREHPEVDFVSIGEKHGNAKALRKAGHLSVHDYLGLPQEQRVTVKAVPFRDLPKITATIDIGLVPLAPTEFNECKSYLKGLEYAGAGIPCIASPSASYKTWAEMTASCRLATKPSEWIAALDEWIGDDDLRRSLGHEAREAASQNTIQEHWRQWERVWEGPSRAEQDRVQELRSSVSTPA